MSDYSKCFSCKKEIKYHFDKRTNDFLKRKEICWDCEIVLQTKLQTMKERLKKMSNRKKLDN